MKKRHSLLLCLMLAAFLAVPAFAAYEYGTYYDETEELWTQELQTLAEEQKRSEGMSITMAAMAAAKARLRPILMTSLTMIFGMLPLMFASGVGANGNISIGVGTVGGMLIGTIALIIIVPALFIVFQYIEEKVIPKRK